MNLGAYTQARLRETAYPEINMFFKDFLSFLKFDMESRGMRLAKEDSMTVDGAILTADSHGDKF